MTADVNVTEKVARAVHVRRCQQADAVDTPMLGWESMPGGYRTATLEQATAALDALADPDVLAGIAGVLVQRGLLGCCVDCPVDHRNDGDDQAREVAAAVVEWLRGGA